MKISIALAVFFGVMGFVFGFIAWIDGDTSISYEESTTVYTSIFFLFTAVMCIIISKLPVPNRRVRLRNVSSTGSGTDLETQ